MYFCDHHFLKHTRSPGAHLIESQIIKITNSQKTQLLPKLQEIVKYLYALKQDIRRSASTLIDSINLKTEESLRYIREIKHATIEMISGNPINKEAFEIVSSFEFKDLNHVTEKVTETKKLIQDMLELYKYKSWKECSEVIFARNDTSGGLDYINLNTFKISSLDYTPIIGGYGQACKIDRDIYFFHGGRINTSTYQGETYIINVKGKYFQTMKAGPCKNHGGSVLKADKVYIFGGYDGNAMNSSDMYDLKTKEWKSIAALPQASYYVTAALIGDQIIVSGYQMDSCYHYNDSGFQNVLKLAASVNKLVCEGWIFFNSVLYENKDENVSRWTTHNVQNPWNTWLCIYTGFKKGEFIYFIDYSRLLIRIDTKLKKLEEIKYS